MVNQQTWSLVDVLLLTLFLVVLFGIGLGHTPLEVPDGARYAEIPREMMVLHDYVTPHLNFCKYFEKPPLFYWLQVGALKIFGINELGAGFINTCMGYLTCLVTYVAGCKLFNRRAAIIASCVLATTTLFFAMTHIVTLDMTLTFFLTASLLCFCSYLVTNKILLGLGIYIFAALATMTKGLIGAIFPAVIIVTYLTIFKAWRKLHLVGGLLCFFSIVIPWHLLVQWQNPEFFHFYFIEQHWLRYLTPYAGRQQPWWFFSVVLLTGFYPWTIFLYHTIKYHLRHHTPITTCLLIWPLVIFGFYTFSDSKLIPYLLPMLPPLALLTGNYLAKTPKQTSNFYTFFFVQIALSIALVIAMYLLDFNKLAFTPLLLARSALLLLLGSLVTLCIFLRFGTLHGLLALCCTTALCLVNFSPVITNINNKSSKPLLSIIKRLAKPSDTIISFGYYYQDMPFYLQRRVVVVNGTGELAFGAQHQPHAQWIIQDMHTFWRLWNKHPAYMILHEADWDKLPQAHNLHVLAKHSNRLLVTNREHL